MCLGVQSYINKLKKVISALKAEELKTPENKIKVVALKATTNINSLVKDFFKIPPAYKTTIQLSFKQSKSTTISQPLTPITTRTVDVITPETVKLSGDDQSKSEPTKKRALITAPEGAPEPKRERKFYTPPSGKFSGGYRGNRRGGSFGGGSLGSSYSYRGNGRTRFSSARRGRRFNVRRF